MTNFSSYKLTCAKPNQVRVQTWRMMRLTVLFLLASTLTISAKSYSKKVDLHPNLKNMWVEHAFNQIRQQTGSSFLWSKRILDIIPSASTPVNNASSKKATRTAPKGLPPYTTIQGKTAYIKHKSIPPLKVKSNVNFLAFPQHKIKGVVRDSVSGEPLVGASVRIKGTTIGTITNADGQFVLEVPDEAVLKISSVGYISKSVSVDGKTTINVSLSATTTGLNQLVVVGYGTQKKKNLTGAVSVVSSERLEDRGITSLGRGLVGVVPGLNVSYNYGDPTESADFNIRGFESINGGSPLILVDGVPKDVNNINPDNIKSVTVLKDAASAAVYGARAGFGVILIETKEGKQGKPQIHFSAQQTLSKPIFPGYEPLVNREGLAREVMNNAYLKTLGRPLFQDTVIQAAYHYHSLKNPQPRDAWLTLNGQLYMLKNILMHDSVFQNFSSQRQYNLSISGASDRASYYVSLGALNERGFFKYHPENYQRYNVLSKVNFHVTDWLSLKEEVSFNSVVNSVPHQYAPYALYRSNIRHFYQPLRFPDLPYYETPGDHEKYAQYIGMYSDYIDAVPFVRYGGRDKNTNNEVWLTQRITVTPLKGLRLNADFSYKYFWSQNEDTKSHVEVLKNFMLPPEIYFGHSASDFIEMGSSKNNYYVFNATADYTRPFGNHLIKVLIGFNQEYSKDRYFSTRSNSLILPNIQSLSATTGAKTNSESKNELMLRGAFYRLNYSYKDKYLFEADGRYDGTSRFPQKDRFGFFPSFSIGWRISQEKFMHSTRTWLDNFKLRASFGELGNQVSGSRYPYVSTMSFSTASFLLSDANILPNAIYPGGLISNSLTWEKVVSKNIGLDASMLDERLSFSFDYYTRGTKDMLMRKSYPMLLGTGAPYENAANLRNKGWEISLRGQILQSKAWNINAKFVLSDHTTTITKYDNPSGAIDDYYVGKKVGEVWGYKTVGLIQDQKELDNLPDQSNLGSSWDLGDVHYADLNSDGKISSGDRTLDDHGDLIRIANTTPRYVFGFNTSIHYKNFSLRLFFQGRMKKTWYPSTGNFLRFFPFTNLAIEKYWLTDTWTPENRDAYFPAKQFTYSDKKNVLPQTRYVQDAKYIRLRSATLSYKIPVDFVKNAVIYLNGENLWEADGMYKTLYPQNPSSLQPGYMVHRNFTIGLKVSF